MTDDKKKVLEARCQRQIIENLRKVGKEIGPRTRMIQIIAEHGVVEGLRSLKNEETSGWNDLYLAGLLGYSAEATVVQSSDFRQLFETDELLKMEVDLRASGYKPVVADNS